MQTNFFCLLTLLFLIFCSSCTTTIYLSRHAEKRNNTDTSTLTEQGQNRAFALRDTLLYKGIDTIFSSVYIRTQLTAQPLASAIGKSIKTYHPDTSINLARQLKRLNGKDVLITGHSDNIPVIIKELCGRDILIGSTDFDNLYVIQIRKFFTTTYSFSQKTYGLPSP